MTKQMTVKEIQAQMRELTKRIGPRADLSIYIGHGEQPLWISLYPYGMTKEEGHLAFHADDFAEALDGINAAWDKYQEQFKATITRKMALAIIRLTDEFGTCTDAALRQEFDNGQVSSYGEAACALADTMAAKGPFGIVRVDGANKADAA